MTHAMEFKLVIHHARPFFVLKSINTIKIDRLLLLLETGKQIKREGRLPFLPLFVLFTPEMKGFTFCKDCYVTVSCSPGRIGTARGGASFKLYWYRIVII